MSPESPLQNRRVYETGPRPSRWKPLMPRVMAKTVIEPNGCWTWQGYTLKGPRGGYGTINYQGRNWLVHRAVYTELVGPIPENHVMDHLCENPACCNPEHLEPVTNEVNMLRGKTFNLAHNALKTHCPRGHEYTEENTRTTFQPHRSGWSRFCKACARIQAAKTERSCVACCLCDWRGKRVADGLDKPCPRCGNQLRFTQRKEAA